MISRRTGERFNRGRLPYPGGGIGAPAAAVDTELRASKRDGSGGNGVLGKRDGSGVYKLSKRRLRADNTNLQFIPDVYGSVSGELHTGHGIYFPTLAAGKVYVFESGTTSTPTLAFNGVNATMKAAMTAGDIPWGAIVYLNKNDPDDAIESWGVNAADGSFDYEDMAVLDLPTIVEQATGFAMTAANTCCFGFSEGGYITLRKRAKYGAAHAAVYVVLDGPRLDADLGGAANSYGSWSASEKTKLWSNSSAIMQAQSPFASIALTGLFNVLGANAGGLGAAPLLMLKSSPGGGAPATNAASMNNAATQLTAAGVTYSEKNLDDAGATPSHVLSQFMTTWALVTDADVDGDVMDVSWIAEKAGW